MFVTKNAQKTPKYFCETCDYSSCVKKDYERHIDTIKHKRRTKVTEYDNLVTELSQKAQCAKFSCKNCNKEYTSRNGIWLHKKKCIIGKKEPTEESNNVILELLKQNQEFKDLIIEQNKQIVELASKVGNTVNNTTNNNSNNTNNNFNLQCLQKSKMDKKNVQFSKTLGLYGK